MVCACVQPMHVQLLGPTHDKPNKISRHLFSAFRTPLNGWLLAFDNIFDEFIARDTEDVVWHAVYHVRSKLFAINSLWWRIAESLDYTRSRLKLSEWECIDRSIEFKAFLRSFDAYVRTFAVEGSPWTS